MQCFEDDNHTVMYFVYQHLIVRCFAVYMPAKDDNKGAINRKKTNPLSFKYWKQNGVASVGVYFVKNLKIVAYNQYVPAFVKTIVPMWLITHRRDLSFYCFLINDVSISVDIFVPCKTMRHSLLTSPDKPTVIRTFLWCVCMTSHTCFVFIRSWVILNTR